MQRIAWCVLLSVLCAASLQAADAAYTIPLRDAKLADGAELIGAGNEAYVHFSPEKNTMRVVTATLKDVVPGRYEVIFRAACPAYSQTGAGLRYITYCKNPSFRHTRVVKGVEAPLDGEPFDDGFTLTLTKPAQLAFEVDVVDNGSDAKDAKKKEADRRPIPEVKVWPIRLVRVDQGVVIDQVRSQKVYYRPGEKGSASVRLQNISEGAIEGTADLEIIHEVANTLPAGSQPFKLAPGEEQTLTFAFPTDALRFGCEARVRVRKGDAVLAEAGEFFSVHEEFWSVGLGGTTRITGHSGLTKLTPESIQEDIEKLRDQYVNWWEKIFWPPDDWGDMTPETENWMSGQSARWESATNIKTYVQALKPHGIQSITYGKHVAVGAAGWDLVRRKPEWFYTGGGKPSGRFHTEDLYTWNDLAYHSTDGRLDHKTFHDVFWTASPDLRKEEVVMHGITEMIESSRRFGWDGVRFDGHWTAGNDALSTHNMQLLKTKLRTYDPDFLFGFNYSWSYGHHTSHMNNRGMVIMEHEFAESMAGGGMYMQEAINHFGYAAAQTYSTWSDYAKKEVAACRGVNQAGGHYYFIYGLPKEPMDKLYKFALGTAAGAHPVYGEQNEVHGARSWPRFLTRWSAILFDKHARTLAPEGVVDVTSERELWWKEWTRERIADAKTRHLIVHLINPPLSDALKDTNDPLPPPAKNVQVRIKIPAGQTLRRVVALDPKVSNEAIELKARQDGGYALVTAGDVAFWRVVVVEFDGHFAVPEAAPFLTKAPDPAEVEAGRKGAGGPVGVDPMRPEVKSTIQGEVAIAETDKSYNSVSALGVDDGDALNGEAQYRPANEKSRSIGRSWAIGLKPGKYIAHLRIKIVDKGAEPAEQEVSFRLLFHGVWDRDVRLGSNPKKYSGDQLLKVDGKYHYYPIPIEMPKAGWPSFLGGTSTSRVGDNELFLDHIAFETVEIYNDAKLQEKDTVKAPAGAPGGDPGLDVYLAKGWTWDTYGLDKLFPEKGGQVRVGGCWSVSSEAEKFPQKHEDLYKYDVVVLANIGAQGLNYEGRRCLKDFVEAGGGLVVLGGLHTLGQGAFTDTFLADLLPVTLHEKDVVQLDSPQTLKPGPQAGKLLAGVDGDAWAGKPSLYWLHEVTLREGAQVHLLAGSSPLLISRTVGKGRVIVFAGTVLGEKQGDETPFWEWASWPKILDAAVRYAAGQ